MNAVSCIGFVIVALGGVPAFALLEQTTVFTSILGQLILGTGVGAAGVYNGTTHHHHHGAHCLTGGMAYDVYNPLPSPPPPGAGLGAWMSASCVAQVRYSSVAIG